MKARGVSSFVACTLLVIVIVHVFNFLFWNYMASKDYLARIRLTQDSALFLEGMVLIILGVLLLLGRGGINFVSLKAAIFGSTSDAVFDRSGSGVAGPSEIFRRDAWKASGFIRFGLILILAGAILLLLYLV